MDSLTNKDIKSAEKLTIATQQLIGELSAHMMSIEDVGRLEMSIEMLTTAAALLGITKNALTAEVRIKIGGNDHR